MSGERAASRGGRDAAALRARLRVRRRDFDVDVAFEVAPGETLAVMGRSGAGKSTILQVLAGLVSLKEGEITVDGRVIDRSSGPRVRTPPMSRGIVLLGQDARLFPHLSARENVAFGPRGSGVAASLARSAADDWLARVGLPDAGDRRPSELSGGERQRVAVARALAAEPRVVLLDEPLVALDPVTASEIRTMLGERLAGVTTVAVTHDAVDAAALADRLMIIEQGRVTQSGPVRKVLAAPATDVAARIAGLERLVGIASDGGWLGGEARLRTTDAASLALARTDGVPLAAVFRAADVRLTLPGARLAATADNVWRATVTHLVPTPTGVRALTDTGAAEIAAAQAATLAPGTEVVLRLAPDLVRFVPVA